MPAEQKKAASKKAESDSARPAASKKTHAKPKCDESKNPGGRPRVFDTSEQFDAAADKYFNDCKKKKIPLTITGLALAMGFNSKQSLYDYQKEEKFSYSVKRVRTMVENGYEIRLHGNNPTGAIFALKNFDGWSDKSSHEVSGPGGSALNPPDLVINFTKGPSDD